MATPEISRRIVNGEWTTTVAEANGGSVVVPVLSTGPIDLTNDQVLTLPTVPVEVLAAPEADQVIVLVGGMVRLNRAGGAYTNIGGSGSLFVLQSTGLLEASCKISFTGLHQANTFVPIIPAIIEQDEAYLPEANTQQLGRGLVISSDNSLGDFTGGDAANYLRVTILYMLLDV